MTALVAKPRGTLRVQTLPFASKVTSVVCTERVENVVAIPAAGTQSRVRCPEFEVAEKVSRICQISPDFCWLGIRQLDVSLQPGRSSVAADLLLRKPQADRQTDRERETTVPSPQYEDMRRCSRIFCNLMSQAKMHQNAQILTLNYIKKFWSHAPYPRIGEEVLLSSSLSVCLSVFLSKVSHTHVRIVTSHAIRSRSFRRRV